MTFRLEWHGEEIKALISEAANEGLLEGAEYILEEANKIIPHKEGNLQNSGETSVDKEKHTAAVSYDTPYAARLHEHPEYEFLHDRQGKWLETTIKTKSARVLEFIQKAISRKYK